MDGSYFYAAGVTSAYGDDDWVIRQYSVEGVEENDSQTFPYNDRYVRLVSFPNPVSHRAIIAYFIPNEMQVHVKIFNGNGQLVQVLLNERKNPGFHSLFWDLRNTGGELVSTGIYFVNLTIGNGKVVTTKLVLLKD